MQAEGRGGLDQAAVDAPQRGPCAATHRENDAEYRLPHLLIYVTSKVTQYESSRHKAQTGNHKQAQHARSSLAEGGGKTNQNRCELFTSTASLLVFSSKMACRLRIRQKCAGWVRCCRCPR